MIWPGQAHRARRALLWATVLLPACGGANAGVVDNPVRQAIEAAIGALDGGQPLRLRYNPASCNCPQTEVFLASHWLRAELQGEPVTAWLAELARLPPEAWPVAMQALGSVEPEALRTDAGSYAVRIDVRKRLP